MLSIVRQSLRSSSSIRLFSAVPARRNAIQDLYVKELKAFKPTPLSAKDAEESVRAWKTPVPPQPQSLEVDAATQLADYEAAEVEVETQTSSSGEAVSEEWFVLEEPEDDHH